MLTTPFCPSFPNEGGRLKNSMTESAITAHLLLAVMANYCRFDHEKRLGTRCRIFENENVVVGKLV
jgi:hypothetical protein